MTFMGGAHVRQPAVVAATGQRILFNSRAEGSAGLYLLRNPATPAKCVVRRAIRQEEAEARWAARRRIDLLRVEPDRSLRSSQMPAIGGRPTQLT